MPGLMESVARRLIIIIVATGTVSVIGGLVIGRYVIPDKGASPDTASVAPAPSTTPTPSPAAIAPTPTLVPKPDSAEGKPADSASTSQIPGLPTRINEFGIPVGYPHNKPGAVSACANYVAGYLDPLNREPARLKEVFRSVSTQPSVADHISQRLIESNNGTAKNFGVPSINSPNFLFRYRVLGYAVDNFSPDEAKIRVWLNTNAGTLDGSPNFKPRDFWGTDLCSVNWNGSDWKLSDSNDGPDGPDPAEQRSEEFQNFLLIGAGA
ncbi:hypothetical protein [Frankia sp. AvcI1]|uniref:hypothetical protein n=1 Tax=Frankia sp. AvcI1 TaxID=573496 RepID=UPI0021178524|nr:hypothetical protein [Frankia sp. AvcI1]